MKMTVKTDMREFQVKIKRLDKAMSQQVLDGAAQDGAFIIQRRAAEIIREKDIIDKGELLNSVVSSEAVDTESSSATLVIKTVGTNVEHGLYNELGTVHMAARPWLRPAFDESQEKVRQAIVLYLRASLENV